MKRNPQFVHFRSQNMKNVYCISPFSVKSAKLTNKLDFLYGQELDKNKFVIVYY